MAAAAEEGMEVDVFIARCGHLHELHDSAVLDFIWDRWVGDGWVRSTTGRFEK